MRVAYADPPYLGQAKRLYGDATYDSLSVHAALIARLITQFPDGWAMSLSSPSMRDLLPLCPPEYRVGAWVKSFCAFKKGVRPCYAWEPVVFVGGRNKYHPPPLKGGKQTTPKDFIIEPIALKKGLTGAKPEKVCRWILDLLIMGRVALSVTALLPSTAPESNNEVTGR